MLADTDGGGTSSSVDERRHETTPTKQTSPAVVRSAA
jgi:hypothetical protein